ncbi:hypothetical protein BU16DRAFT_282352 [Lophium mytilinum]|uniref:Uncharacterized protein n=1 Tax=Lophium mytilinum TaxID=390894 RepID=A0A6A6R5K5_9PEZI|nr:hypothetical protein BU16DRAFT_282352 [Lophium mytilinum]
MGQLLSTANPAPDSQAPPIIPLAAARFPPSPPSSTAGDRESYVRIGELGALVKDLEGRLDAAAKENAAVQKYLLGQLVAQTGLISAPVPDVSAQDARLEACLKRIGELEKEVEASKQRQEARQIAEDFISFEEEEILDAEVLTPSQGLQIGPVAVEFGEDRKEAEEPLEVVKGKEKATPDPADSQPSRVSIPPHLRYQSEKKTVLDPQDSRANVSRGRSPAPRPRPDLKGAADVNQPGPSNRVQTGAGLTASKYGPGPPGPPRNAPTGPRIPTQSAYFTHIEPPAPGTIHRTEDLRYAPEDVTGTRRSVLILGIPRQVRLYQVLQLVTTGELISARLAKTGTITGFETAYLVFAEERAAVELAQNGPLVIKGRRLTVSLINSPTWRMSRELHDGVVNKGWTRFIRIADLPADFEPANLEHHLRLLTCEWQINPALRYWNMDGDLWVEFEGVMEAKAAVEHFAHLFRQVGCAVRFGRDPNIFDESEDGEDESEYGDEYDGDGEETAQDEQAAAGADERPLIEF